MRKKTNAHSQEHGYTLIEVIVAVVILSMLLTVAVQNLAPARESTNDRDARSAMETARGTAVLCVFRTSNLNPPGDGVRVCAESEVDWPVFSSFGSDWEYDNGVFEGDVLDRTFTFRAVRDGKSITCTETECTASEL